MCQAYACFFTYCIRPAGTTPAAGCSHRILSSDADTTEFFTIQDFPDSKNVSV